MSSDLTELFPEHRTDSCPSGAYARQKKMLQMIQKVLILENPLSKRYSHLLSQSLQWLP